jgi:hypothetical protein
MTGPQAEPQPPAFPAGPGQAGPAQPVQFALGMAETPAGQRLALVAVSGPLNLTLLLTAAEAKQLAKQVADAASSMSTSGLVVANGVMQK